MKNITISFPNFSVVTRTGKEAHLIGIDTENKKVEVIIGTKNSIISFATAVAYKTPDGQNLNEKFLNELASKAGEEEATLSIEIEIPATEGDGKYQPETIPAKKTDAIENENIEDKQEDPDADENIPQGTIATTVAPDSENENLVYIEDLATLVGYKAKVLRKKLRKLQADHIIFKTNHTWCWDKRSLDWTSLVEYLLALKNKKGA